MVLGNRMFTVCFFPASKPTGVLLSTNCMAKVRIKSSVVALVAPSVVMHSTIKLLGAYIPAAVAVAGGVAVWSWMSVGAKSVS